MKRTLATLLILAPLAGSVSADLVFGGDFQIYKPGTDPKYSVTGELSGPGFFDTYAKGMGDGIPLLGGTARVDFSDGTDSTTTGDLVDIPGWKIINGGTPDNGKNGVGGTTGCNIFAGWGGQQRLESDPSIGTVEAGKIYTIAAMIDGGPGSPLESPLVFQLLADGTPLTPSAEETPTAGGLGFQTISRTYDTSSTAGQTGASMTIVLGVEDTNTAGGRMIWDDVTLDVEDAPGPDTFPLTITPTPGSPGNYDFEWSSLDDYLYDLVSNTDLSTPPTTWPVWDSRADLVGTAPTDEFLNVPGVDPKRFFAVIRKDPPPLFSVDFEANDGGFTALPGLGTDWAWGAPISATDGATPNPGGAVTAGNGNSTNCWGTGIGNPGYYANPTTNSCLRSPDFSLVGVTAATLTFAEALDIVTPPDVAEVKLINAVGDVEIATVYTANDANDSSANWEPANGGTPIDLSAGIGQSVYLKWCLTGSGGADYMGWYIDDVVVTAN